MSVDLTGEQRGRLTIVKFSHKDKHKHLVWECLCECGNVIFATTSNLNNTTKSCGCLNKEKITKHGLHNTRFYQIWADMKTRCSCTSNSCYEDYGGRGITYDAAWESFENFYKDMFTSYSEELTLDRIDVDGNYTKENCRWATVSQQNHNKRKKSNTASKYTGVALDRRFNKWYARIAKQHIGTYQTEYEAAVAYDNASEKMFGDRPNKTTQEVKCN